MISWLKLGGAVAVIGVISWQSYNLGYSSCEAARNAERIARIEAGIKLEQARRKVALERDQLSRKLEEQAHEEPVAIERCLSPGRVQRLNAIR